MQQIHKYTESAQSQIDVLQICKRICKMGGGVQIGEHMAMKCAMEKYSKYQQRASTLHDTKE